MGRFRVIDKILNFLDDGIPKNDFDRELLASNLIGAQNLKELSKRERIITLQEESPLAFFVTQASPYKAVRILV